MIKMCHCYTSLSCGDFFKVAPPPLKRCILLRRTARLKTKKKQRSFATDQDPLGENYICDHCDPLLRNH